MRQQQTDDPTAENSVAPSEPGELNKEELQHVAGGINPQPLPPGHDTHAW